jgi:hypothetical protein
MAPPIRQARLLNAHIFTRNWCAVIVSEFPGVSQSSVISYSPASVSGLAVSCSKRSCRLCAFSFQIASICQRRGVRARTCPPTARLTENRSLFASPSYFSGTDPPRSVFGLRTSSPKELRPPTYLAPRPVRRTFPVSRRIAKSSRIDMCLI